MICPKCTTEFQEVRTDERCLGCGACVNPWTPQVAIAAFDGQLKLENKLILLKSVPDWRVIIEAQNPAAATNPNIADLTDTYTQKLLEWVYNNPPTPVTYLSSFPADNGLWRVERSMEQRFLNSVDD